MFLVGSAVAAAGLLAEPAFSQSPPAAGQPLAASDIVIGAHPRSAGR